MERARLHTPPTNPDLDWRSAERRGRRDQMEGARTQILRCVGRARPSGEGASRALGSRRSWAAIIGFALGCGGGDSGTQPIGPVVASVIVSPPAATLQVGGTMQLSAEVRDASNRVLTAPSITWVSLAPAIASVGVDGTVTGLAQGAASLVASAQGRADSASLTVIATHDPDSLGVPRIIAKDYIDVSKIDRASRFRSGFGHDYSDGVETCRSMKHYFQPLGTVSWSDVAIVSPVTGEIVALVPETTFGTQAQIVPTAFPAATVIIFHLNPAAGLHVGQTVQAGDTLGTHIGSQTLSDIAIRLRNLTGYRLVSYFDAMPDSVFAAYQALGVASRDSLIIGRAARDASPLQCSGEAFLDAGTITNWVDLP